MQNKTNFIISNSDLEWCKTNNVKVTEPGSKDYPEAFGDLLYRPSVLFYIGEPIWQRYPLVSVVGSRAPSHTSLSWMDVEIASVLRLSKLAIVSGGARGVDQKAHQISLRYERPTCAFLPSGLRMIYPPNLNEWVQPIVNSGGCVISQFLPSQPMMKSYFRERNRLIAAISPLTLVVECRRRSGTLLTAKYALEFERRLAVLPTSPGESGMGGLDLICDSGAHTVRDARDLILIYGSYLKELGFDHLSKVK